MDERRGVGAGIALISMTPVVLLIGVFKAFSGAVACGDNGPGVPCPGGPGWANPFAVVLPAVLGIASLLVVLVPVLIVIG